MKKNLESLKDKKREISSKNEDVKYTKIERQIDNLIDEIKRKEAEMNLKILIIIILIHKKWTFSKKNQYNV